ncbi:MAG: hypothetical protein ABIJ84_00115 [bacterium]
MTPSEIIEAIDKKAEQKLSPKMTTLDMIEAKNKKIAEIEAIFEIPRKE